MARDCRWRRKSRIRRRSGPAAGAADLPAIWNQGVRKGLHLHWDGNNGSLFERNISAAIGAGVTPESVDLPRIERIARWLQQVPAPASKLTPSSPEAQAAGKALYAKHCQNCHGSADSQWRGELTETIVSIDEIGTDRSRLDSHTTSFVSSQWTIGAGHPFRFRHFRKTHGYAAPPLDGIWARAPYLHNGSVPTLKDLLAAPDADTRETKATRSAQIRRGTSGELPDKVARSLLEARAHGARPLLFYRGDDVLDHERGGFIVERANDGKRDLTLYDTSKEGCDNTGHRYGTDLTTAAKEELLAYLKTL